MITYRDTIEGIAPDQLSGFFVGWPNPPSPENHLRFLRGGSHVGLALTDEGEAVVGYVTRDGQSFVMVKPDGDSARS
jgi:hypothetical protein